MYQIEESNAVKNDIPKLDSFYLLSVTYGPVDFKTTQAVTATESAGNPSDSIDTSHNIEI